MKRPTKKHQLYYQNTRGLGSKADIFFNNVITTNYDIICITETWLNSSHSSSDYFPTNYNVYRNDRASRTRGGGCLIAIKDNLI